MNYLINKRRALLGTFSQQKTLPSGLMKEIADIIRADEWVNYTNRLSSNKGTNTAIFEIKDDFNKIVIKSNSQTQDVGASNMYLVYMNDLNSVGTRIRASNFKEYELVLNHNFRYLVISSGYSSYLEGLGSAGWNTTTVEFSK